MNRNTVSVIWWLKPYSYNMDAKGHAVPHSTTCLKYKCVNKQICEISAEGEIQDERVQNYFIRVHNLPRSMHTTHLLTTMITLSTRKRQWTILPTVYTCNLNIIFIVKNSFISIQYVCNLLQIFIVVESHKLLVVKIINSYSIYMNSR